MKFLSRISSKNKHFKIPYFGNIVDLNNKQHVTAGIIIVLIASIGTILLNSSHAASPSPFASISMDKGTITAPACTVTNTGASDGSAVQFGGCSTTTNCNLNATTANFSSQLTATEPGQVLCLASGDYTSFPTSLNEASPGITITSAPGATVEFNSGIAMNLSSTQNVTIDGTAGGGTISINGQLDLETNGDAFQSKALNLIFKNIAFGPYNGSVFIEGAENSNIVFDRDTFTSANIACTNGSPAGLGGDFYVFSTATPTTSSGVTVENSVFVASADLWDPDRAIDDLAPMTVENNVFTGFLDHTESTSCNHIDVLQLFSGTPGTTGDTVFTGNLCYDDYGCIEGFDGTSDNTVTDNACFDMERSCVVLYSDVGSTINHNTMETGGADPSGCDTLNDASAPIQACTNENLFENGNKTGDPVGSGELFTNNASDDAPNIGDTSAVATDTNNLWSGASSPNISGSPSFIGGLNPTTWAGFELTSGSIGYAGGSDGLDVGIRASAGGPPTGGGSVPVNTIAPVVSGTATEGDTLTTTNGTWTITGNVPTVTTYQWFDCSTSTFSNSSCTPIQPETAPTSANNSTYTLQASDVGDYVFAEITVTNANGQVNALSNASGTIAE